MTPTWIDPEAGRALRPPAEILLLGELPRSPVKLLSVTRALLVLTAARYQRSENGTKCNIFTSDVMQIMQAPLPHVFDLGDGYGPRELNANDTADGLRALKFPGWSKIGTIASAKAAADLAALGQPTIAIWKNPTVITKNGKPLLDALGRPRHGSGHVMPLVPTPAGKRGPYVTGAGAKCVQECPIADSFGPYLSAVEFYGYVR